MIECWPEKGDRMRMVAQPREWPGSGELQHVLEHIMPGEVYTVEWCNIGASRHVVKFDGIDPWFNGDMFERVD